MPANKKNFTATEIKAGAMVLVAIVVMAGFIGAIRGCGSGGDEVNTFHADFTSIIGLNLGADVRFGGVKAGKVIDISADPEDRSQIRVVFEVPADVPVNYGCVATIDQISLTTAKHLEISTGGKDQPLHVSGDRIQAYTKESGFVDIPDLEGVITRLETMLDGVITMLGVERAQAIAGETGAELVDLAAVMADLDALLRAGTSTAETVDATISENREGLREIFDRLVEMETAATELLTNLNAAVEENRSPLNQTMVNFEELSRTASDRLEELTQSLAVTLEYLQDVGGNTSALLDNQGPTLEQILINLEATTRNLKHFSETLAEQPNALVRGSKPKGRPDGGK